MVAAPGAVAAVTPDQPGFHQLKVANVQGGSETNPLWMSNVSNNDLRSALESSLKAFSYLADDPDRANLQVSASIVDLQRPLAGLDLTVTSKVHYTVSPAGGGAPLYDNTVAASGTATFSDALIAVERLRMANEASIKANIASFIEQLRATLKAPKPTS
jgi:hypothetical protein